MSSTMRGFTCAMCGHSFEVPYGAPRPPACPRCGSPLIHRANKGPRRRRRGRRRGGGG